MSFNPMDIPPGSGPSLSGDPKKPWFKNVVLWIVVALVLVGTILYAY